jgi:hypothetical protein
MDYMKKITNKSKQTKKKSKQTKKKSKQTKKKLTNKSKHKRISKSQLMIILLNKELKKRFCKCTKSIKYGKNKVNKGSEYAICYKSVYINRGIKPPKNVIKSCNKKK